MTTPTYDRPATTKPCPDCGVDLRVLFYTDKTGRKTNARCKPCHREHTSKYWHALSPVQKQATRVRTMYGMEPEAYIELHKKQDGKCAICKQVPKTKRGLHLDHCHETGAIRGLLCHNCNVALGCFNDNPALMLRAIQYLGG